VTHVELLVATLLLLVSLSGLITLWLYMIRSSISTDDRGAAYECARMVMERTRSIGFHFTQPQTMSVPGADVQSTWASGHWVVTRYFDANLQELESTLQPFDGTDNTAIPDGTRFLATTDVTHGDAPPGRDDLAMVGIEIKVYLVDAQKEQIVPEITSLQTSLSEGGI
jgi:hypothetical protein